MVQDSVGTGFGSRDCANSIGTNVYFGSRCSYRPKRSPAIFSRDNIYSQDFQQHSWSTQLLIMARLDVESATKQIQEIAEDLHPMYNKFIGREVCNKRKIFTSGTSTHDSSGSRKKIRPLGFANYPHFDRRDKIHSKAVEYFENTFRKRMEG